MQTASAQAKTSKAAAEPAKVKASGAQPTPAAINPTWMRMALAVQPKVTADSPDDMPTRLTTLRHKPETRSATREPQADSPQDTQSDVAAPAAARSASRVHSLAAKGVSQASSPLPGAARIQAAFGRHDISGVRAQIGGPAAEVSQMLGARAYTLGQRIGFEREPDVRLAAHEAAHVVQQRCGVSLKDGIGRPGDKYERQADAVAERVTAGRSAEDLLESNDSSDRGPQRYLQAKCDCGGACATCSSSPTKQDEDTAVQMELAVNATRLFEPAVGGNAEAPAERARDGPGAKSEEDGAARAPSGRSGTQADVDGGETDDAAGAGAAAAGASPRPPAATSDGAASLDPPAAGGASAGVGANRDASSAEAALGSASAITQAGPSGAPVSAAATPAAASGAGGGTVTSGGQGACSGGGVARCYSEPSEEPAEEPAEAPPNPAPTEVKEETRPGEEPDLPEPDDCPAERPGAAASAPDGGAPPAASGSGASSLASLAPAAAAAGPSASPATAGAAAGAGPSVTGSGDGAPRAATSAAADAAPMSAGSPLDGMIASAEAQRGMAVGEYARSVAALGTASEVTSALRGGTRFAEPRNESPVDVTRRRAASSRADNFFSGVADRLDEVIAVASEEVPSQLDAAAESAKAQIAGSIETQKGAISARVEHARDQARANAAMARGSVMRQTSAFVTDARTQTAGAIEALRVTHRETMDQVNELETSTLDIVSQIYADDRIDLEGLGTTVGDECTAKGEEFAATYRGFRHCTENGFWDGDLSERRSMAQEKAAHSVAKGYHDSIVDKASKRAREVVKAGRKSDRCSVIASANVARNTLDNQLSKLTSALETARDAVIQQAANTSDGLLTSIDASLATTLRQLDRQEHDQRQAADDTGYMQQVLQEQISHTAAAAVQRGVQTAVASAQSALSAVRAQCSANTAPEPATLDQALSQVEQNIYEALGGLQAAAQGGSTAGQAQLGATAQQGLGALADVTQTNDDMARAVVGGFASAMSAIAGTDNFATQRTGFTQQVQQSTAAGSAALSQALEAMREGCDATTKSAKTALTQAHTDLEKNLRQSKEGLECEIPKQADEAASHEAPAWKMLIAIVLIIIVVVIVIAVTILTAGGALAALGPIAAIAVGAAIGAAVGAVTSGLLAIAGNLMSNRSWSRGVGHAVLVGAITGAIGGGLGAGVGVALKGASTAVQLSAAMLTAGGFDVVTQYVMGGFSFKNFSWTNLGITLFVTVLTLGLAHGVAGRPAGAPVSEGGTPPAPESTAPQAMEPDALKPPDSMPEPSLVASREEPPAISTPREELPPVATPGDEVPPATLEEEPSIVGTEDEVPTSTPEEEAPPGAAPNEEPAPVKPPDETPPAKQPWEEGRNPARYRRYVRNLQRRNSGREPLGPEEWWNEYGSKPPANPGGGEGKQDHRSVVEDLRTHAQSEYPPPKYRVTSNRSIPGVRQKPDVAVIDTETGKVVKVYEAARFNKSGGLVRPDERAKIPDYEGAGIPYEFHPVGPNKPPGGVLSSSPTETLPPVAE
jgi:hypothetical protein